MRTVLLKLNLFLYMALPLRLFGQTAAPVDAGKAVATVDGQSISEQELLDTVGAQQLMQLRTQEYQTKDKALENLIRLKLVQTAARKRGTTAEKLISQEVESKVLDPTDGEVEAYFWGQNREGTRFEDVKDQYRAALKQLKLLKARQVYADSLRSKFAVTVLLGPPTVDVAYDPARVKGNPDAPVTIVEFSDFQCPFCKKSESTLNDLLTKYGGRVKLAYMDFPLREMHPQASKAAEAARCAGEQGKFWEYHDVLYKNQTKLNGAELLTYARTLNLDEKSFQSCLDSGKFKSKVEADLEQGQKVGVAGTPGFFINGVFLSGAQPQAEFEKIIDHQLELIDGRHGPQ